DDLYPSSRLIPNAIQNSLGFSPVDRPGDIRPRRPDDSTLNPLSRPSSQKKTQFYGDFRESLLQRITTLKPDRLNGGGCSLQRTALCDQFPLTGKSTGNFLDFGLVPSEGNALSPCIQDIYCVILLNPACKEQGIKKCVSGNCVP